MADKSKGHNFSLSATNSTTIAKFSYMNASPATVLKVNHKTLQLCNVENYSSEESNKKYSFQAV